MKLYAYIFFQFRNYYNQLWEALIAFVAIILINLLSLLFILASIFDFDPGFYRTGSYFVDRFFRIPLFLILPICLLIFILYLANRDRVEKYFKEFRKSRNGKLKVLMILYLVLSGLFFAFSIVSSKLL